MHSTRNPAGFLKTLGQLPKFIRLIFRLFCDRRVQLFPKIIVVAALFYALSPLDFIPEPLFPLIGYTDDALLVLMAVKHLLKSCPPAVLDEHVARIEARQTAGK